MNNPNLSCTGGFVHSFYEPNAENYIILNLNDDTGNYGGGSFQVTLYFDDAVNGNAGLSFPTIDPLTDVRAVQPELRIRSTRWSDATQESRVIISNVLYDSPRGVLDNAVFKRDDNVNIFNVPAISMWTSTQDYASQMKHFIQFPTNDGSAQGNGHYLRWNTNREWGLGLGLLAGDVSSPVRYDAVLTSSMNAQLKWVFKQDYTAPDPSGYVAPQLSDITVETVSGNTPAGGAIGNGERVGDSANPIIITDPNFTLTWTGSSVSGLWQIRGMDRIRHLEVRTPWMNASDPSLTNTGNDTWSWSESGSNGVNLNPGQIVELEIRTRDANNTVMGAQIVSERLHIMGPVAAP